MYIAVFVGLVNDCLTCLLFTAVVAPVESPKISPKPLQEPPLIIATEVCSSSSEQGPPSREETIVSASSLVEEAWRSHPNLADDPIQLHHKTHTEVKVKRKCIIAWNWSSFFLCHITIMKIKYYYTHIFFSLSHSIIVHSIYLLWTCEHNCHII